MKFLVSTTTFLRTLYNALEIDCHAITYTDRRLGFLTKKYQKDFSLHVEEVGSQFSEEVIKFNATRMVRLMDLLKTLSDQPIVITIEEDRVRCEQFVIDF